MREEMVRVQNDNDRLEERVTALEAQQATQRARHDSTGPRIERPRLKVVHLAPEDQGTAEAPVVPTEQGPVASSSTAQTDAERPMIKGSGQKVYRTGGEAGTDSKGAP